MSRRELATPPSLLPLYARAAATAPLRRGSGSDLPDSELVLRAQRIDADRLAAYQRLCGFRVQDVLPPTYLHVLAFPVIRRADDRAVVPVRRLPGWCMSAT